MSNYQQLQSEHPEKKDWQVEKLGGLCEGIRPFLKELAHLPSKEQIRKHVEVAIQELETIWQLAELLTHDAYKGINEHTGTGEQSPIKEHGYKTVEHVETPPKPSGQVPKETSPVVRQNAVNYLLKETATIVYAASHTPPYTITYISENVQSIAGYAPSRFIEDVNFWKSCIHPDDAPSVIETLPDILEKKVLALEYRFRFSDGTYHWIFDSMRLAYNESGEVNGRFGNWTDITEKKNAEEKVAQLLQETERLNDQLSATEEQMQQALDQSLTLNEKLVACEQFSQQLIDNVQEAIVAYDKELRFLAWNTFAEKIFNTPSAKAIGKSPFDIFPDLLAKEPERYELLKRALAGETVNYPDFYIPQRETTGDWFSGVLSPLKNSQGEIIGVISTSSVITDRKRVEEENERLLKETRLLNEKLGASEVKARQALENVLEANQKLAESEMFNRQIIDNVNAGIAVWDRDIHYVVWNAFLERVSGKSEDELRGKHPFDEFPELFERDMSHYYFFQRALAGETVYYPDYYVEIGETKNWYSGTFLPFRNSQGEIIGVMNTTNLITERKLAEQALLHQKNLLQSFYDAANFYMCVFELKEDDFVYQLPNQHMARFWGLSVEEMAGKSAKELKLLSQEDFAYWFEMFRSCVDTGKTIHREYTVSRPNGGVEWHFASFSPIDDERSISFISTNITERKHAEEEKNQLLKETQMLNEELRASEEEVRRTLEKTLDVNEQLAASEQFAKQIISSANEAIAVYDKDLRFVVWNTFAEKIFGLPAEKVVGKHPLELFGEVFEKEPERYHQMQRALNGEVVYYTDLYIPLSDTNGMWLSGVHGPFRNPRGEIVGVISMGNLITERKQAEQALLNQKNLLQASANYLNKIINTLIDPVFVKDRQHRWVLVNDALCSFLQMDRTQLIGKTDYDILPKAEADVFCQQDDFVFTTGQEDIHEEVLTQPDGKSYILLTKKSLYIDSAGEPFIVGIFVDITDRKRIEQKLLQQNEDLRKINAELDSFVYRTSHDLRAPLVSILGLINVIRLEKEEPKKSVYLDLMEKSITRLDTFISDIINYSRNSRLEITRTPIDFRSMVDETLEGLKFLEGFDTIEKKIQVDQTVSFISDVFRIKVICNNLISNAIKYRSTLTGGSYIFIHVEVNKEKAVMKFKDNGVGIPKENLDKIFNMFYRASASGTGSGLGLYIVKDVVHTLKGSIKVQSKPGKGTTFTVEVPNLIEK